MNEQQREKAQILLVKTRIEGGISALESMAHAFKISGDESCKKVLDWAEVYRYMLAKVDDVGALSGLEKVIENLETPPTINQ